MYRGTPALRANIEVVVLTEHEIIVLARGEVAL